MTNAVLTIRQPWADRIMSGLKRYEFRRKAPTREIDGLYIHIAGTGPYAQGLVGVNCVRTDTPEALWEWCGQYSAIAPVGMSREEFFEYFDGCEEATAISLAPEPIALEPPVLLSYLGMRGAPQSLAYAKERPAPTSPDYTCPYCGHGQMSDYADWEGCEFEDRASVQCERCGQSFDVYREWIACYTNVEPDTCAMCPASSSTGSFDDGWKCRINGCEAMREE